MIFILANTSHLAHQIIKTCGIPSNSLYVHWVTPTDIHYKLRGSRSPIVLTLSCSHVNTEIREMIQVHHGLLVPIYCEQCDQVLLQTLAQAQIKLRELGDEAAKSGNDSPMSHS